MNEPVQKQTDGDRKQMSTFITEADDTKAAILTEEEHLPDGL